MYEKIHVLKSSMNIMNANIDRFYEGKYGRPQYNIYGCTMYNVFSFGYYIT